MKMYIAGAACDASDGRVRNVYNSATGEVIDTIPSATREDVEKAVKSANEYKKIWRAVPQQKRSEILIRASMLISEHAEELARILSQNMGKVITEAYGEAQAAAQIIKGYAEAADRMMGDVLPQYQKGGENDIIFTRHEPFGVAAAILPFNFPVELASHKIAAGLATGNVVIFKPASDNPLASVRMVELLYEAGIPMEALQVITGPGEIVGNYLSESEGIDIVAMTGSTAAGVTIAKRGAATLKKVYLELGGNDPFIVMEDADIDLAVKEAIAGRIQCCGQTCCAPKRFFIHKTVKDEFTAKLMQGLTSLKWGSPLDESTQMGCLINPKAAEKVKEQVDLTVSQGAKILMGGNRIKETYFEPTILSDVDTSMNIAHEMEVFGPVFPIIEYEDEQEMIAAANDTPYALQAGIFTKNINKAMKTAAALECGGVVINGGSAYRNCDQAFGGGKMTGIGREGISHTLDHYVQTKSYIMKGVLA